MNNKVLLKIINNHKKIIKLAKNFGYENLRIFCPYYEEDKDKLNFLADFNASKMKKNNIDQNINKLLGKLLGIKTVVWGKGALALRDFDYQEAAKTPFLDIDKVKKYFVEILIPYATDTEPKEELELELAMGLEPATC